MGEVVGKKKKKTAPDRLYRDSFALRVHAVLLQACWIATGYHHFYGVQLDKSRVFFFVLLLFPCWRW